MRAALLHPFASTSPRRLLIGLGALMISGAVAIGSGANFNSSSANPGTLITGATILVTDSLPGQSILSAAQLKPGGSVSATVNVKNGGNVPATFQLTTTNLLDIPATPPFSAKLRLEVDDLGDPACSPSCPTPVVLYSGAVNALGTLALGSFAAGATHEYRFTVVFPDGGPGGADNAYGGSSTRVDFRWTATQ
jgi:spore coat-associated protein N